MSDGSERELAGVDSIAGGWCETSFSNTLSSSVAADANMSMFMVECEWPPRTGGRGSSFTVGGRLPSVSGDFFPLLAIDVGDDSDDESDTSSFPAVAIFMGGVGSKLVLLLAVLVLLARS